MAAFPSAANSVGAANRRAAGGALLSRRVAIQLCNVNEDIAVELSGTLSKLRNVGYIEIETGIGGSAIPYPMASATSCKFNYPPRKG